MLTDRGSVYLLAALILAGSCLIELSANQSASPRVRVVTMPVTMAAGSSTSLRLEIIISSPYHIQANPASYNYLIPAQLELQAITGLALDKPVYPPGKSYQLTGSDLDLSVYDGRISIIQMLHSRHTLSAGTYELKGSFRFQACDNRRCLPPETLQLTQQVQIVAAQ